MHHSDPAEQLRVAASQGHLSKCRELLERHQNIVNERGRDESTALFRACYNGHLEIVKLLVANGADIERKCTDFDCIVLEITPLMSACKKQDVSVIEYLLSAGARLEEISKYQELTALHFAARTGNEHIVKLLFKAGAKQEKDAEGRTPLFNAAIGGHDHLLPLLLDNISAQEEWDAWKILGCTYVEVNEDLVGGLIAWRKAVSKEGVNELINNGDVKVDIDWSNAEKRRIYKGYPKEAITLQEVDNLANDIDAIYTQALLIKERVFGEQSASINASLDFRAWRLCLSGRWERGSDFWLYIIKLHQNYFAPLSQPPTYYILQRPITAIKCILEENEDDLDTMGWCSEEIHRLECRKQVKLEWLVKYLGIIVNELERYFDVKKKIEKGETNRMKSGWEHLMPPCVEMCEQLRVMITELIYCIGRVNQVEMSLFPQMNYTIPDTPCSQWQTNCKQFLLSLHKAKVLIDRISPDTGLFYTACQYCLEQNDSDSVIFVLEQLLEVNKHFQSFPSDSSLLKLHGTNRETPLHAILRAWIPETSDKLVPIVELLLNAGAPLLAKDCSNVTCFGLLQKCLKNNNGGQTMLIGKFMSLKQITAARLRCVLNSADNDYVCLAKSLLPQQLWEYIQIF